MAVPAPAAGPPEVAPSPAPVVPAPRRRARASTPQLLRLWFLAAALGCAVTAVTALATAQALATATDRLHDQTGPALVGMQEIAASLAEADASATSVFLSGGTDRTAQRLYDEAMARAGARVVDVARLVGDDETSRAGLERVAAGALRYGAGVEEARTGVGVGAPGAVASLEAAQRFLRDDLSPTVAAVTAQTQERLDADIDAGRVQLVVALLVGVATLGVLLAAQWFLFARTRRLLNLPLVAATLILVFTLGWLVRDQRAQQSAVDDARSGGYDAIALTAEIQRTAFQYKGDENLGLITGTSVVEQSDQEALARALSADDIDDSTYGAARQGDTRGTGLLHDVNRSADADRERAASAELLVRWQRYLEVSRTITEAVIGGDRDGAVAAAVGPGGQAFNGFNTTVEAVLAENREQFLSTLDDARSGLAGLRLVTVVGPLLVALAALWGFQLRLAEYR